MVIVFYICSFPAPFWGCSRNCPGRWEGEHLRSTKVAEPGGLFLLVVRKEVAASELMSERALRPLSPCSQGSWRESIDLVPILGQGNRSIILIPVVVCSGCWPVGIRNASGIMRETHRMSPRRHTNFGTDEVKLNVFEPWPYQCSSWRPAAVEALVFN